MKFTAAQIAKIINGAIQGDPNKTVTHLSKIEEANSESLCFLANPKYYHFAQNTLAAILLVDRDFKNPTPDTTTLISVEDPYLAMTQLMKLVEDFMKTKEQATINQPSFIHESVKYGENLSLGRFSSIEAGCEIGENVTIYPNVFIGKGVKIGDNTIIYANVSIYEGCIVGKSCVLHSGCVLGSDGFGFAPNASGAYEKIPQLGVVELEDMVEIGANTVIDRASLGKTLIKSGAKLDNLIQIAHNVEIGHHTVIAAQAGISGSTKVGNQVMIGGQAGIVGHIHIADKAKINAQSGVSKSITQEGSAVTGSPAFDYHQMLKAQSLLKKLPEIVKRINTLEQKIN
ncbi:MAG: UDP-3-O-(3-hydroxymyristoyl)glucosamine N-acyltransferase [Chitinophagales bacterium]|nr:UDP-3-O-(3-hydroxymyristoyl)glucosamine N-acyltransferase [Chitinophagales bacterium]